MEPPQCGVDPLDYSTRLPPRKRLLANLKKQASPPELPTLSFHFNSAKLRTRVQELLDLTASFPEDGIQVSKSIASEAEEVAVAARAAAVEKAMVAVRAKAFAKSVLEVVASLPKCLEHQDSSCSLRMKGKKKQVAVQRFYDSKVAILTCGDDEKLPRLHQPLKITRKSNTQKGRLVKPIKKHSVVFCDKSSSMPCKSDSNGVSADHESVHSDTERKTTHCSGNDDTGMKSAVLRQGKKVGIKRKKLPLSQFDSDNNKGPIVANISKYRPIANEHESEPTTSPSALMKDEKPSSGDDVSDEKEPSLNCKRLKISQLYAGKKILQPLGSKTRLVKASAVV